MQCLLLAHSCMEPFSLPGPETDEVTRRPFSQFEAQKQDMLSTRAVQYENIDYVCKTFEWLFRHDFQCMSMV